MSEELFKAMEDFDWSIKPDTMPWRIHYDPANNGRITQIGRQDHTNSQDPYIEVDAHIGQQFIAGQRYQREYHVLDGKLDKVKIVFDVNEAGDKQVNQVSSEDEITAGTYFITVKGDPDLIIDTISVTAENLEAESGRIKEYLENNDCFKDQ
mgnify:FL=1|tara:strand:+ start:100 stop:555 length:456 start_codon:yes stop_codon:yes gene_type:complete